MIAQNREQQDLLRKNHSKTSVVIRSIYENQESILEEHDSSEVLWISSIQTWKRPELFLNLAKTVPNVRFRMIGGLSVDKEYYDQIDLQAKSIHNLEFTGFIPPKEIQGYYKKAIIFVNTSDSEGFPNTFLEAWSNGVPVVSLNVDPDEIICQNRLGFHSKNFAQLVIDTNKLLQNRELRDEFGRNGKKYIEKEHSAKAICDQYEEVIQKLLKNTN